MCFVVCCLFMSTVFGQVCFVGINPNIAGLNSDGVLALVEYEGETVNYFLNLSLPLSNCPVEDITGFMTLPDGTVVVLPPIPNLNPGDSYDFGGSIIASYVLDTADWGSQPGADADEVRTTVNLFGTAITSETTTQPAEGFSTFDTEVLPVDTCILVTKEACPYSKVGDEVIYDITITNCGNVDLDFTGVTDTLLDDSTVETALLNAGCATLAAEGGSCNFQVPYIVQPGDDTGPGAILVNVIEVSYTHTATGQSVSDDDDAVVTLLHPSFTTEVECIEIIDETALFDVTFCNTGDVPLMVDPHDPGIQPFPLPNGECATFPVQMPAEVGICGAATATKTIAADASILLPQETPEECLLGNIITPDPAEASATCTVETAPNFTAEKVCLDDSPLDTADGFADFQINFANTGDVPLLFEIDDPAANGYHSIEGPIAPGGSGFVIVSVPTAVQIGCPADDVPNAATVTGLCLSDGSPVRTDPVDATCPGACADFDVEKTCLTPSGLTDGSIAEYGIVITNTGTVPLDLIIDDPSAEPPLVGVPITLAPGETFSTTVTRTVVCAEPGQYTIENTVSVVAVAPDGTQIGPKTSTAECPYECGGAEGCTPGFWKNHPDCWCDAYTPDMLASDVFTRLASAPYDTLGDDETPSKSDFNNDTLMDALKYRGGADLAGSVRNLLRHATAALLNGCSSDVFYPVSDLIVIDLVNAALDSEDQATVQELHSVLAGFNEDYPCPINAHCERTEPIVN